MGQSLSSTGLPIFLRAVQLADSLSSSLHPVSELKTLTKEQLLHEITLLNNITDELTRNSSKTVRFVVKEGTDDSFLWKVTIRIVCEKVIRDTGSICSRKTVTLRRFLRLYSDIMHQLSASASTTSSMDNRSNTCASLILDRIDDSSSLQNVALDECVICMERSCDVLLSCTHGYCEPCIKQWSKTNAEVIGDQGTGGTCPVCRDPLEPSEEHWVLAEGNDNSHNDMPAILLGLVDKACQSRRSVPYDTA